MKKVEQSETTKLPSKHEEGCLCYHCRVSKWNEGKCT